MFICERCGRSFTTGAVAVVGFPQPDLCQRCRARLRRIGERNQARVDRNQRLMHERLAALVMLVAAIICLAGMLRSEWRRDDYRPPEFEAPPEPPEELPRVPVTRSAVVMSIDY